MGDKFYDYWQGYERVQLLPGMVKAPWGANPKAVEFTNRALDLWYRARKNVRGLGVGVKGGEALRKKLNEKLEDAACEGSSVTGWGDLKTALKKLGREGGDRNQWKDDLVDTYHGNRADSPFHKTIWPGTVNNVPQAAAKFMEALDTQMKDFRSLLGMHNQYAGVVIRAAKDPAGGWKTIKSGLEMINTTAEKASSYLFLAPPVLSLHDKGAIYSRKAEQLVEKTTSFMEVITKFGKYILPAFSAAHEYGGYRRAGFNRRDAAGFAVVKTALGYLPVLGNFYAHALDMIPGLKKWFEGLVRAHTHKIDSIPGLWNPNR